ncbi:hypothetical protein [Methanosarcina mazei]|uniref:hypothetical protein n=1 Tax=Methanosarcina mazei TaxID=2209 RepID=UPI0012D3DDC3|nr:hypothetical protein [Methanosarcina mazei]
MTNENSNLQNIKKYVEGHREFLERTAKYGSIIDRGIASAFLRIAKGEVTL